MSSPEVPRWQGCEARSELIYVNGIQPHVSQTGGTLPPEDDMSEPRWIWHEGCQDGSEFVYVYFI